VIMKDIKKIAKGYKEKNGNDKISNKDLLFYILSRLDDIEHGDSEQDKKITKIETRQNLSMWFIGISLGVIGLVFTYWRI